MNRTNTTLAAIAGSALLAAGAIAGSPCCPTAPGSAANGTAANGTAAAPGNTRSWSSSNSISVQHNSGEDPVVVINGHQINDDDIEIAADGSILINDGAGNMINLMDQLGGQLGAMNLGSMGSMSAPWGNMTPPATAPPHTAMETRAIIGVELQPVSPALASHLGLANGTGVLVADLGRSLPAAQSGMQQWDIITAVDGLPVASAREFSAALAQIDPGTGVVIDCIRQGVATTATVTPTLVEVPRQAQAPWPAGVSPQHGAMHNNMMQDHMARMQSLMDQMMSGSPFGGGLHQSWPMDPHQPLQAIPAPPAPRPMPRGERTPLTPIDRDEAI